MLSPPRVEDADGFDGVVLPGEGGLAAVADLQKSVRPLVQAARPVVHIKALTHRVIELPDQKGSPASSLSSKNRAGVMVTTVR